MSAYNYRIKNWKDLIPLMMFILLPFTLIILQKETGSALVFLAFTLMLYREGMNGFILLLGVFAILLFVVVIKYSIIPIGIEQGTLGSLLASALILLVQLGYALVFSKHRRDALILLAGVAEKSNSVVVITGTKINFNYVAVFAVLASSVSGRLWAVIQAIQKIQDACCH
jgi:rod shape determining protein RodA